MLRRATSNVCSWWWASHIRTKQSNWLDDDLHGQSLLEFSLKILILSKGKKRNKIGASSTNLDSFKKIQAES
ncbi:hypothetical protein B296_00003783 [Ensete ventricosum]|uniref:Uncharacterized protein n=1 Tax=Ensete ventricosum TaxID=4639 RepID=A0A427AGD3_ENSVE|nr:hypothetical protein B296_00003783 [Ensete ventricosum]